MPVNFKRRYTNPSALPSRKKKSTRGSSAATVAIFSFQATPSLHIFVASSSTTTAGPVKLRTGSATHRRPKVLQFVTRRTHSASRQVSRGSGSFKQLEGVPDSPCAAQTTNQRDEFQGLADTQSTLGSMYHHGQGTLQNYKEALKLVQKAADQGGAQAQSDSGLMYNQANGTAATAAAAALTRKKSHQPQNLPG